MPHEAIFENADALILSRSPINKAVSRVGSHPDCEVQFAGLDPHALTIRMSKSGFSISNRTNDDILVGENALPNGKSIRLHDDDRVNIQGLVWMRISLAETPAASDNAESQQIRSAIPAGVVSQAAPEDRDTASGDVVSAFGGTTNSEESDCGEKTNPLLIAVALVLSVIVAGLFFFMPSNDDGASSSSTSPQLAELMSSFDELHDSDLIPNDLNYASLQAATSELRKGNLPEVRGFLIHLRDACELSKKRTLADSTQQKSIDKIIQYCNANI